LYKKLTAYDEFMHILEYFVTRYCPESPLS
jgi:hypothetical protein